MPSLVNRDARPAFPALLAMMSREAILANDLYAHNATAVSGGGRLVHLVDLVHLVYLVGLVHPNKQDKPNKPNKRDRLADFFSILLEMESGHGLHGETSRSIHPAMAARFRAFGRRSPSRTASVPQRGVGSPRWCLARDRPACTRPPAPAP